MIKIYLRNNDFLSRLQLQKKTMKLLTHNMLTSKCMKAVTTGYPLAIQARDVKVVQREGIPKHGSIFVKVVKVVQRETIHKHLACMEVFL